MGDQARRGSAHRLQFFYLLEHCSGDGGQDRRSRGLVLVQISILMIRKVNLPKGIDADSPTVEISHYSLNFWIPFADRSRGRIIECGKATSSLCRFHTLLDKQEQNNYP
jgi:hypothetical protein